MKELPLTEPMLARRPLTRARCLGVVQRRDAADLLGDPALEGRSQGTISRTKRIHDLQATALLARRHPDRGPGIAPANGVAHSLLLHRVPPPPHLTDTRLHRPALRSEGHPTVEGHEGLAEVGAGDIESLLLDELLLAKQCTED